MPTKKALLRNAIVTPDRPTRCRGALGRKRPRRPSGSARPRFRSPRRCRPGHASRFAPAPHYTHSITVRETRRIGTEIARPAKPEILKKPVDITYTNEYNVHVFI
jgi:hypothetical protein